MQTEDENILDSQVSLFDDDDDNDENVGGGRKMEVAMVRKNMNEEYQKSMQGF